MQKFEKLTKQDIHKLTKTISPWICVGDECYKEKFKQVYYLKQGVDFNDGVYLPYIISSFGRIFSIKPNGYLHQRSPSVDKNGYNLIVLDVYGKKLGVRIHRLVATTFIKNTNPDKNEVNHIDGVKTHNFVWNLEWTTSSENKQHAIKNHLSNFASCEDSGKAIYTNKQIESVCKMLEDNILSKTEIANITGVSQHMVNDIYKHRYWNKISCKYDFSKRNRSDEEYIERVRTVCKMIEDNRSYKDIEDATGFGFKFVSGIYHKKTLRKISDKFDFSRYNYGK